MQKVGKAIAPEGINVLFNQGEIAGQMANKIGRPLENTLYTHIHSSSSFLKINGRAYAYTIRYTGEYISPTNL